jgi:hypothetical protein
MDEVAANEGVKFIECRVSLRALTSRYLRFD